MNRYFTCRV